MIAARSELLGGDHRLLYLALLMGIQRDHVDDEDTEPPVPAGLADLSGALRAVADFLDIDEDLIAVAAEASPSLKEKPAVPKKNARQQPKPPLTTGGWTISPVPKPLHGHPCARRSVPAQADAPAAAG